MLAVCCRGNSQFQSNVGNGAGNQSFKLGRKMEMLDLCHMHGNGLQCDDKGVLLKLGHCLTYNDTENTATLGMCPYFDIRCYNITVAIVDNSSSTFVRLPQNISELNHFMCGPLNREGFFCLDCIDGYGISLVSIGYRCSNCTNVWYGVLLYLTVELLPATLFYLLILLFDINLTTAPVTCFITLNQLILLVALKIKPAPFDIVISQIEHSTLFQVYLALGGVWNLDFFHYLVPPFCVSSGLRQVDVAYFGYISAFYPFLLIFLTWIFVELHDRNRLPTAWLCRIFNSRCCKLRRRSLNIRNRIITCFTSFLLLSYTKIMYQSYMVLVHPPMMQQHGDDSQSLILIEYATIDPRSLKARTINFTVAVPILLVFNILPVIILIFYSFKCSRACLSKCRLNCLALTAFTEKFYGCYKDGLNGEKDLRFLSGFFFILRYLAISQYYLFRYIPNVSSWLYGSFLLMITAVMIAYLKPYKKSYMNVMDIFLLLYFSVICRLLDRKSFVAEPTQLCIVLIGPSIVYELLFIVAQVIKCSKFQSLQL